MKMFSSIPPPTRSLWAKSGTPSGHSLLVHMLDVAAVAEVILSRESAATLRWASKSFGLPIGAASRWLAAFCGLHDFGKAIPGFQTKWPEGRQRDEAVGLKFSPNAVLQADRHDLATAALLGAELAKLFPDTSWTKAVAQALGAHHGYFPVGREISDTGGPTAPPADHDADPPDRSHETPLRPTSGRLPMRWKDYILRQGSRVVCKGGWV